MTSSSLTPKETKPVPKVQGTYCDWLFSKHDLSSDLKWGQEFAAAANIGANPDKAKKMVNYAATLQVLLRDMHLALARNILRVRKNERARAIELLRKLPCSGILSSRFNYRLISVTYLTSGWYGCVELDWFQAPLTICDKFPSNFVRMARCMLQFRNLIRWTVNNYMDLMEVEVDLGEGPVFGDESKTIWNSPRHERTPRSSSKSKQSGNNEVEEGND